VRSDNPDGGPISPGTDFLGIYAVRYHLIDLSFPAIYSRFRKLSVYFSQTVESLEIYLCLDHSAQAPGNPAKSNLGTRVNLGGNSVNRPEQPFTCRSFPTRELKAVFGLAFINHQLINHGITKYKTTPKSFRKMQTLSTHIHLFIPILPSTTT
jgi:hypothetical protein